MPDEHITSVQQDMALIDIEVAYATSEQQVIVSLRMPEGVTVAEAIEASNLLHQFPEIDSKNLKTGIFSKLCNLNHTLKQADRIEIYRPLHYDPKEARRQRAAKK